MQDDPFFCAAIGFRSWPRHPKADAKPLLVRVSCLFSIIRCTTPIRNNIMCAKRVAHRWISIFAGALLVFSSSVFGQVTAIRVGTIIDPAHGTSVKDQVILVEHGKITAIGSRISIPAGAELIDLRNEWLTAGLIDAHTHMTLSVSFAGDAPFEAIYLSQSSTLRGLHGLHNAQLALHRGFTTLRDVGNSAEYAMSDVRRAIDAGLFMGPTIIDAGKMIAPFGGQSHDIPPRQGPLWRYEYIDADGPDEIRKAVRTNIYYGAGVIKLVADNNQYHWSIDEFRAAVTEAHRAGVPVAVHVYSGDALDNAIQFGFDVLHGGWIGQHALDEQHGVVVVDFCYRESVRSHLGVPLRELCPHDGRALIGKRLADGHLDGDHILGRYPYDPNAMHYTSNGLIEEITEAAILFVAPGVRIACLEYFQQCQRGQLLDVRVRLPGSGIRERAGLTQGNAGGAGVQQQRRGDDQNTLAKHGNRSSIGWSNRIQVLGNAKSAAHGTHRTYTSYTSHQPRTTKHLLSRFLQPFAYHLW